MRQTPFGEQLICLTKPWLGRFANGTPANVKKVQDHFRGPTHNNFAHPVENVAVGAVDLAPNIQQKSEVVGAGPPAGKTLG